MFSFSIKNFIVKNIHMEEKDYSLNFSWNFTEKAIVSIQLTNPGREIWNDDFLDTSENQTFIFVETSSLEQLLKISKMQKFLAVLAWSCVLSFLTSECRGKSCFHLEQCLEPLTNIHFDKHWTKKVLDLNVIFAGTGINNTNYDISPIQSK